MGLQSVRRGFGRFRHSGWLRRCVLALLAAAAFVAFWRYRIGIIPIVLTCAAVGIIDTLAT